MVVKAFIQSTRALMAKFGIDAPDIRIEGTRDHQTDPQGRVVEIQEHRLGEARQCELRGAVGGLVHDAQPTPEARDIDDRSRALLEHSRQQGLDDADRRQQIDPQGFLEVARAEAANLADLRNGGVVDDHVQPAEVLHRGLHQCLDLCIVGHVAAPGQGALGRQRGGHAVQQVFVQVAQDHVGAFGSKALGHAAADARCRPGDDDGLVAKSMQVAAPRAEPDPFSKATWPAPAACVGQRDRLL